MSGHHEKISKGKQGFVDRLGWDSRRLQLLFLSDTEKSCEQIPKPGGKQTGNFPKKFQKHVQLLGSLLLSPGKYQLVAALLANSL